MIVAHHLGEELLPTLLASGATAASMFLALVRARLGDFFRRRH